MLGSKHAVQQEAKSASVVRVGYCELSIKINSKVQQKGAL